MDFSGALRRADLMQQRSRALSLVVGLIKKFSDDRGSSLAALLAYYGFLSLFPLLLVFTTLLGFVGGDEVARSVIGTTLSQFPVFGEQIGTSATHPLRGSGIGLVLGLVILLYGALGAVQTGQYVMAQVWNVPLVARPGFWPRLGRSVAVVSVLGVGMGLSALASGIGTLDNQTTGVRILAILVTTALNVGLWIVGFRLLTPRGVRTRALVPGACVGAVAYTVFVALGTALIQHQLRHSEAVYGQFGFVLGLLGWLAIVAQIAVMAAELNAVLNRHLWPRSFTTAALTTADTRALRLLAVQETRRSEAAFRVDLAPDSPGVDSAIVPASRTRE